MAKGIINNIGTGGGGKLFISSFDAQQRGSFVPGRELGFTSSIKLGEAYLVEGTVAPNTNGDYIFAVTSVLNASPTIITGNESGVTVGVNEVCFVKSTGKIAGNVSVNGGVLVVQGGNANGNVSIGPDSTIIGNTGATIGGGSFEVTGGGKNASVAFKNCTINGKFSTTGITYVDLGNNNFNGSVTSKSDEYVVVEGNSINLGKDLSVTLVVVDCKISGNTVTGTTTLDPKCQP